jgi:hypothetical protein
MAKKQFFAIVDTETTICDTVADFACIIVDRDGIIHNQCAVIIQSEFSKGLFYDVKNPLWSKENATKKANDYQAMMQSGSRVLGSVNAVNRWIDKAIGKYNPILTAYNLPFDTAKCANTQIDLTGFSDRFCLWAGAVGNICQTKQYKNLEKNINKKKHHSSNQIMSSWLPSFWAINSTTSSSTPTNR